MEERDIARCENSGSLATSSSRPQANLGFGGSFDMSGNGGDLNGSTQHSSPTHLSLITKAKIAR
jgi:hypothetical protein